MLKVSQLIKFISELNPQITPARLSFFNFLKGFPTPEEDVTAEVLDQYFNYAMDYPHWVSNKGPLSHEVKLLLENFNSFFQSKFDINQVRFPEKTQLIEIENNNDAVEVIERHVKSLCGAEDKFKIIQDQGKHFLAIVLRQDRSLQIRSFDRKFTLRNGLLEPLRKDLALYYTPDLELSPDHIHRIEVAPYITAQFKIVDGKVFGALLRGYVFQKLQEFKGERLETLSRLHIPIKRVEQYFVDRKTDPFYQEIITQLERTRSLVQHGDPAAVKWATVIIAKAESALENIYHGDKMLNLLIRDLRFTAESRLQGRVESYHLTTDEEEGDTEECLKISPLRKLDLIN